jgi:hypothetical protein
MPHANTRNRKPALAAVVVLLLACLGLAACGSSSSSTTSTSANAASTGNASGTSSTGSTSTTPGGPGNGRGAARFAAMRECLEKNGITLPKRTPGSRPGTGRGFPGAGAGGGPQLPSGVTRAQYEAALKKCGGGSGHFFSGGARRLNNPVFKAALTKYGDCLRENGINLPAPNTSGNGPIFDTKGINTSSSQFKAASVKCRSTLIGAFRRPAGAPGAAGTAPAGGPRAGGESSTG